MERWLVIIPRQVGGAVKPAGWVENCFCGMKGNCLAWIWVKITGEEQEEDWGWEAQAWAAPHQGNPATLHWLHRSFRSSVCLEQVHPLRLHLPSGREKKKKPRRGC